MNEFSFEGSLPFSETGKNCTNKNLHEVTIKTDNYKKCYKLKITLMH